MCKYKYICIRKQQRVHKYTHIHKHTNLGTLTHGEILPSNTTNIKINES